MNKWTGTIYHDEKGRVLGEIMEFGNKYKALQNSMFLGWFVNEIFAKNAVEDAREFENTNSIRDDISQLR